MPAVPPVPRLGSVTVKVWIPHEGGVALLPGFPQGAVQVEVYRGLDTPMPSDPAGVEFWTPPFLSQGGVVSMTEKMTSLRVIQLLSAGADAWIGKIPGEVTLCDARGVHTSPVAEWTVAVILGYLRRLPAFVRAQEHQQWSYAAHTPTDTLYGKRVLILGAGSIGTAICDRLAPFEAKLIKVARRARPADGVHGVAELPALLPAADIVVLIVPLTPQTRGLVDAAFLARMRDGALLVNAARGSVVDTGALVAELASGRLHAVVDVTEPEPLPPGHPLWTMENLLLTPHVASSVRNLLRRAYELVGEQIGRVLAGAPLTNVVTDGY